MAISIWFKFCFIFKLCVSKIILWNNISYLNLNFDRIIEIKLFISIIREIIIISLLFSIIIIIIIKLWRKED